MLQPIVMKMPLAPTPVIGPKYSKTVKLKKGQSLEVADPTATRAMVAMMDMQAVLGGAASHFGGPSAFAELMSAIYGLAFHWGQVSGQNWYEYMQIINDAGHCENGIYALKANYGFADLNLESLKGFRSINSPLTGHGESHLFPKGVYLSNGPLGSSLPQAQGLAIADSLAGRKRLTVTAISDGACMEGEAKESLAAIPGLARKNRLAPFVLVISDNNTKLSGRIDDQSFSMAATFKSLSALGWKVVELSDPHNLQASTTCLEQAFDQAMEVPTQPIAIHARTIKGYGVKKTTESASGGHGFPLKKATELKAFVEEIYQAEIYQEKIYQSKSVPSEFLSWCDELVTLEKTLAEKPKDKVFGLVDNNLKIEKVQAGVAKAMIKAYKKGYPVFSVSSDLQGSTGTAGFHKECPKNCLDVGVAESNMVSVAAGLSKEGFIPFVDTFSQFGVTKGALPFIMSSLSQAPMIGIFSHAGFQDAADGASHQALSYFAMLSSVPYVDVYCLTSSEEAENLVSQAIENFYQKRKNHEVPNTSVFFLGRETFPSRFIAAGSDYKLGQAQVVVDNTSQFDRSVTIAAAGPLLPQAIEASELLAEKSISSCVVNPSVINKPDVATFKSCLDKTKGHLLTVEDHQVVGGMGAMLIHALIRSGVTIKAQSLGVELKFGQSAYKADELYRCHELDSTSILRQAQGLLSPSYE